MKANSLTVIETLQYTWGILLKSLHFIYLNMLLPIAKALGKLVSLEVVKIHHKFNLIKKTKDTFLDSGAGLVSGLMAAKLINYFFETRDIHNFWGLFSKKTVVSETTYTGLVFFSEFAVALLVFTLCEHYLDEGKQWVARKKDEQSSYMPFDNEEQD